MILNVTVEELLNLQKKGEIVVIDIRSPAEYARGTIPGSLNIPLFDDGERQEIGNAYKLSGLRAAKVKGLTIVADKLPDYVQQFRQIEARKAVFCQNGGIRSKIAAKALTLLGARVFRVVGGYRAYFHYVRAEHAWRWG